eukprot:1298536-Lingulodinium_polyedra.AAC.1
MALAPGAAGLTVKQVHYECQEWHRENRTEVSFMVKVIGDVDAQREATRKGGRPTAADSDEAELAALVQVVRRHAGADDRPASGGRGRGRRGAGRGRGSRGGTGPALAEQSEGQEVGAPGQEASSDEDGDGHLAMPAHIEQEWRGAAASSAAPAAAQAPEPGAADAAPVEAPAPPAPPPAPAAPGPVAVRRPDGYVWLGDEQKLGRVSYSWNGARCRMFVYCRKHQCYKGIASTKNPHESGAIRWLEAGLDVGSKGDHEGMFARMVTQR